MNSFKLISFLAIFIILISCKEKPNLEEFVNMEEKISQYARTEINYDKSLLDENQKIVVQKLYEAAKIIDEIFLEQVYYKNVEIRQILSKSEEPLDKLKLEYFNINFGPFDRLDHDKPFVGTEPKPLGANFYPKDITKEEFDNWLKAHPEDEKEFTSEFTVIRREGDKLISIPYSVFYKDQLSKVAQLLREAAEYADNASLKKYLELRAKGLETNFYFESDMAWMDLKDHTIEVVIGPYEVYEDALFNYKASFECFLTLVDPAETKKIEQFAKYLNEMESNLPIAKKYKNFDRGG
ncbi:MAG: peptidase, partial [Ignavibacteriae bacterium]|nr:peptidase [Ignavibacteriota bacterium]